MAIYEKIKNLKHPVFHEEEKISKPIKADIYGPEAEFVQIGFRTKGANNTNNIIDELIGMIMYNGQAGLIDIDIVKKQKLLNAYAYNIINKDYGSFTLVGYPLEGQSLEEVEAILLDKLEKIKKGEFDDWLQEAIINNEKLNKLRQIDNNSYIYSILNSFILETDWKEQVSRLDNMGEISKQEIIDYTKKNFNDNYAVVYKRKGENKNIVNVKKPPITPIAIDRTKESKFFKEFKDIPETKLKPDFIKFKEKIKTGNIGNIEFNYIQNKNNELTSVYFIFDMGRYNIKELEFALNYFNYLGTEDYSSEEIAKEYYKLGVYTGVKADGDRSVIYLSGLNNNFEKALNFFVGNIKNVKADEKSLLKYIKTLKKQRSNEQVNQGKINNNLKYFAKYGKDNPARYNLTNKELDKINADKLVKLISHIFDYKHYILYYGPDTYDKAKDMITKVCNSSKKLIKLPTEKEFSEQDTSGKLFFIDYDMVQSIITLMTKDEKFNSENYAFIKMFNEFYGYGLSSVVFQELRESKGLVYSAYSYMTVPKKKNKSHYIQASLQTQPDKINDAIDAMLNILSNIPDAKEQFEAARQAALAKMESKRITKENIFWRYLQDKKLGIDYNIDQVVYEKLKTMTYKDFIKFFNKSIADNKFDMIILGKKNAIDFEILKKYGNVKELKVEDIFNY